MNRNKNKSGQKAAQKKNTAVQKDLARASLQPATLGGAIATRSRKLPGVSDINDLTLSYQAGYVYVGNGTLGANLSVYYQENTATNNFTYLAPIAPGDAEVGQSYCADILKHFARKRVKSILLDFVPTASSTSNSMQVIAAPYRGGNFAPTVSTTTGASPSTAGVQGMKDHIDLSAWQSATINLTPYIAGGSGPRQNEFNMSASTAEASAPSAASNSLDVPCGFIVTGTATTSGLAGTYTHRVVVTMVLDLLDFIAGITPSSVEMSTSKPFKFSAVREDEKEYCCAASSSSPATSWFGGGSSTSAPPPPPLKRQ